jgi:Pyridoxamine 5'-phosphate oxidase
MKQMTETERREFLVALPARTGKLAVMRENGRPYVVPIWFDLDGDEIVFTTGAETIKGRSIRRDRHVCLSTTSGLPSPTSRSRPKPEPPTTWTRCSPGQHASGAATWAQTLPSGSAGGTPYRASF